MPLKELMEEALRQYPTSKSDLIAIIESLYEANTSKETCRFCESPVRVHYSMEGGFYIHRCEHCGIDDIVTHLTIQSKRINNSSYPNGLFLRGKREEFRDDFIHFDSYFFQTIELRSKDKAIISMPFTTSERMFSSKYFAHLYDELSQQYSQIRTELTQALANTPNMFESLNISYKPNFFHHLQFTECMLGGIDFVATDVPSQTKSKWKKLIKKNNDFIDKVMKKHGLYFDFLQTKMCGNQTMKSSYYEEGAHTYKEKPINSDCIISLGINHLVNTSINKGWEINTSVIRETSLIREYEKFQETLRK